jgi:hypothetical protein
MATRTVKIKPERLNKGESLDTLYYIAEDNGDRCFVSPMVCDMFIVPQELVAKSDLILQ